MRKLLNTLFVTTETVYASLDNNNVVLKDGEQLLKSYPLNILEGIYLFTYPGASPALIGKCAELGIQLTFMTPRGKFLARACSSSHGNVLLRRQQYRMADDEAVCCAVARNFVAGKLSNSRHVVNRCKRDHADRVDAEHFAAVEKHLHSLQEEVMQTTDLDRLRGLEGIGANYYFEIFGEMILRSKQEFCFSGRNRRPPLDRPNALLSFCYSLLTGDCASALEMVGLDSYVGFMHRDRPGRKSMALDLMEELRPCFVDRFVLTLINNRIINQKDFDVQENGAVWLDENGRKKVLANWQEQKQQIIEHPWLKEKIAWGLVPYTQALMLARYLRGDMEAYPPFIWRG